MAAGEVVASEDKAMWQSLTTAVFGETAGSPLPARLTQVISREQERSEILVSAVQLFLVIAFAVLYTLSRKTFPPDAPFVPVPWALAAYFLFTAIRLGLALGGGLPRWFLALSVIIDMTLLLGLIWSFHIQYGQPAAFYLKAPTLLYVFIFIALRALRFEPQFVMLAGLTAALGWLALVYYAAVIDATHSMLTRDYVHYMTSASVLLGAEFDKVISIVLVTAILAVAIVRARRMLERSVREEAAARDLSRFFAPEVAAQITGAESRVRPGEGELRDAAVLYIDIRDFTKLSMAVAPSAVMQVLADYEARMVPVIQRHGGSVDKFLGDGIMATFGAATPSARYAAEALEAVRELVATAAAWSEERRGRGRTPLRVGFGVAVGPVVFGAVGDESRLEYTVIGEAANLAAKLEKHTKAERVTALTTAETLALAEAQGYVADEPSRRLAGVQVLGVEGLRDLVVIAP